MTTIYAPGVTSKSLTVFIGDDTGLGVTGLLAATFPALTYQIAGANAAVAFPALSDLALITTAWASGGVKELSGGYYRLDCPDAMFTSAGKVKVIGEATGKHVISDVVDVSYPQIDARQWLGGTIPAPTVTGVPNVNTKTINDIATTSITTINANVGTTQPTNFTGTAGSALVKADAIDIGSTIQTGRDIGASVLLAASQHVIVDSGTVTMISGNVNGNVSGSVASVLAPVQVNNIGESSAALNAVASAFTQTTGSVTSGTYASTATLDGVSHITADAAGTLDEYYDFALGATGQICTGFQFEGYLVGVTNSLKVYAYNWVSIGWDQIGTLAGVSTVTDQLFEYDLINAHTKNDGTVRIRFQNTGLTAASLTADRLLLGYTVVLTPPANWSTSNIDSSGRVLLQPAQAGVTIPTVTTVANQLTTAQIATGIFQDTVAGDFTAANSIGKSILNGVTLGTGLTINGYTGNTPQTGDSFLRIGAPVGASISADIAEIEAETDGIAAIPTNPLLTSDTRLNHLDADISSRMATYTQPTGFLAATFPAGTIASTTNITAGIITTTTNLTNAGPDTAGTTSLLARLTSARSGYLDNLNVGGVVASHGDIAAINQSASKHVLLQTVGYYERPESATTVYTVEARTYAAADGSVVNADTTPTLTATGQTSGSLSGNLSAATNPATGVYRWTYTVSSTDTTEPIRFDVSATISTVVFTLSCYSQVLDDVSKTWTSTDATHLTAIYNKLPANNIADETLVLAAVGTPMQTGDATVVAIKTQTDKMSFDGSSYIKSDPQTLANAGDLNATQKTSVTTAATMATPTVALGNVAHGGAAATIMAASVTVTNSAGNAVALQSTGGNGHGLYVTGQGSGDGVHFIGGATGHGANMQGGSTSGDGLHSFAATQGNGITAVHAGSGQYDIVGNIHGTIDTATNVTNAVTTSANATETAIKTKTDQLTFTNPNSVDATASVSAGSIRTALGMASANLDTQLGEIATDTDTLLTQATTPPTTAAIAAAILAMPSHKLATDINGDVTATVDIATIVADVVAGLTASGVTVNGASISAIATALAASLGGSNITVAKPPVVGVAVDVIAGDDYYSADGRALIWTLTGTYPDYTSATVLMVVEGIGTFAGTIVTPTGSTRVVQVELSKTNTLSFAKTQGYYVQVTLSGGHVTTPIRGTLNAAEQ